MLLTGDCLSCRQDLYEKAGLEGERIVFLLTDTQITHEAFLEVGLRFAKPLDLSGSLFCKAKIAVDVLGYVLTAVSKCRTSTTCSTAARCLACLGWKTRNGWPPACVSGWKRVERLPPRSAAWSSASAGRIPLVQQIGALRSEVW